MGAAMSAPTCPYCGAERSARKSVVEFKCGTACFRDGAHVRDWDCYERQLAQQAAEIERLKQAVRCLVGIRSEMNATKEIGIE
jgi:hypothetical protein